MQRLSGVLLAAMLAGGVSCAAEPALRASKGGPPPDWPIVEIPRLGIEVWENRAGVPPTVPHPFVWVWRISEGSPADKAGLQSGNTLERVGGEVVFTAADVERTLDRFSPGEAVPVVVDKQWASSTPTHAVNLLPGPEAALGIGVADEEIRDGMTYVNHKLGIRFSVPSKDWGTLGAGPTALWGLDPADKCQIRSNDQIVWGGLHLWELSLSADAFVQTNDTWVTGWVAAQGGTVQKLSTQVQGDWSRVDWLETWPTRVSHTVHLLRTRGKMNCRFWFSVSEQQWNARKDEIEAIARTFDWKDQAVHCVVSGLVEGSPAAMAGVQKSDGLLAINGESLPNGSADFHRLPKTLSPGQEIRIDLERGGERKRVKAILATPARPALVFRNPPGWEGAREVDNLLRIDQPEAIFGWTPGTSAWVKTVYMPGPEGPIAKINRFHKVALDGTVLDPERYLGGPLLPGCQPLDPKAFVRAGPRPTFPVKIGSTTYFARTDIVYNQFEAKVGSASRSVSPRRSFTVELHRESPAPSSIPGRSILLGEFPGVFGTWGGWTWRDPGSIVVYEDGHLWFPDWKVENWRLVSIEFKERPLTAAEAFKLQPFEGIQPAELNNAIVRWKNADFDIILREGKTADLRSQAGQIEQTILEANSAGEREKDEAQRLIEKGQPGAEPHAERGRAWRARIEVLKPILMALKDEIANRGK